MSQKIKITLGLLLLVAGFLVLRLGLFFDQSFKVAATANIGSHASSQPIEENPLLKDSDNDGIPDVNEAYYRTDPANSDTDGDGFLDGEEIASGHNPLKKDSVDPNQTTKKNVTNTLADRFVEGLVAGDLNPRNGKGDKFNQGLNTLALAALDEAGQNLTPSDTNNLPLSITDDSKTSQEEYLNKISELLDGPFLNTFMAQPQTLNATVQNILVGNNEEAIKTFDDRYTMFTGAYTSLLTVSVPPKWLSFHRELLSIFQKIALDYGAAKKLSDDPVLALAAISDLINPFTEIQSSLLQQMRNLISSQNLSTPKTPLFDVLNMLDN